MSMIIDGTNGLTFNNATTQASAGSVLQVVTGTYSTQVTTTVDSSAQDTGLTATITPKFSTSKILVLAMNNVGSTNSAGQNSVSYFQIVRGSTVICNSRFQVGNALASGTNAVLIGYINNSLIDSPATTSATTYKMQMFSNATTITTTSAINGYLATITLMEIAA